jgi:enterochelin esterase-like enzyme
MSISDTAAAVIAKMQAAMDDQNRIISQLDAQQGPTAPTNLELAEQLRKAQADFEQARRELGRPEDGQTL